MLTRVNSGIIKKLERAIEHRDALMVEQEASRSLRAHTYTFEHNNHEDTNPMSWAQWRVDDPGEPLPMRLGLILGDLVHNLRSALDYAAWEAATDESRATDPRAIQFPIYMERRGFTNKARALRRQYPEAIVDFLDECPPYHTPDELLHPLAVLQALSNGDKHQVLQVVRRAQVFVDDVVIVPAPSGGITSEIGNGPMERGVVAARIEFPRPPSKREIEVRAQIGWYEGVRYEHHGVECWLRIDNMLNAICPDVVEKVSALGYITHRADNAPPQS